ncbi:ABC transporter permease [Desulfovibrio sp. OttesenSCG-928-I05]|nr:ABC transporter permease [Desulfovibrio sp. OttesenSCG-928-I05]
MRRRAGFSGWGATLLPALGGMAALLLVWQLAAWLLHLRALPGPLDVAAALPSGLAQGLGAHAAVSVRRVLLGLGLSLGIGLLFGIPMGYCRSFDRYARPVLYFSYPVPKLALLPVVMLLFGVGEAAKICVIVLILAFPLMVSVRDAVRAIPEEDFALFITLRASFMQTLRHVILPASLPALFSAVRVSIGIAFSALFFTETFGTDKGLGFYITDCWMRLDYPHMYLGIVVLSLAGVALFMAADLCARALVPWKMDK